MSVTSDNRPQEINHHNNPTLNFNREWTLWQTPKPDNIRRDNQQPLNTNKAAQESLVKNIASFENSDELWSIYCYISKPNNLQAGSSQHLFEKGVKPMWEDEINKNGGRWYLRLKKGLADRYWEELFLAIIGEEKLHQNICDITGIVISCKWNEDIIQVWNKNGHDAGIRNNIRKMLKDVLRLSDSTVLEYKTHPSKEQKNAFSFVCFSNGKENKTPVEDSNYNSNYNKSYDKNNQKQFRDNSYWNDRKYKDQRTNYEKYDTKQTKDNDWNQKQNNQNNNGNIRGKKWQKRDNQDVENYWGRDRNYNDYAGEKQYGNEYGDKKNKKWDNFKRKDESDKKQ